MLYSMMNDYRKNSLYCQGKPGHRNLKNFSQFVKKWVLINLVLEAVQKGMIRLQAGRDNGVCLV